MSSFEYISITSTTNNRYICESRDRNNRRLTVVAESTDTIEDIMNKLETELEPSEAELNRLKEEKTAMMERQAELAKNVEELNEANKNAARTLAATYDPEAFKTYIKWKDALEKGFLNPGELVFYKGRLYTVISPTEINEELPPDSDARVYLDISDSVNKSDLKKEKYKDKKEDVE